MRYIIWYIFVSEFDGLIQIENRTTDGLHILVVIHVNLKIPSTSVLEE